MESTFVAIGRLASIVSAGGAYKSTKSDVEVLKLVREFTEATFDNRYSDVSAYVNWTPWATWFKAVAWDATFLFVDKKTGTVTVLLITDTD